MTVVVDASVVIKWLINDAEREDQTDRATQLMTRIIDGREPVVQPLHWLVEVGAVLARVSPATAVDDVVLLQALELPLDESPSVIGLACLLAIDLRQHLFDTLYHAVALETPGASLITADDKYFASAASRGGIVRLSEWQES